MLFPPQIARKRLSSTLKFFFEDLEKVCNVNKWKYDPPINNEKVWKNSMITIEEILQYPSGRPQTYQITYNIPSFVTSTQIGYKHIINITIPDSYPNNLSQVKINHKTKLNHPRNMGNYLCLKVNGEMDRIIMNLLNQLLWEKNDIYGELEDFKRNDNGNRKVLLREMEKMWGY